MELVKTGEPLDVAEPRRKISLINVWNDRSDLLKMEVVELLYDPAEDDEEGKDPVPVVRLLVEVIVAESVDVSMMEVVETELVEELPVPVGPTDAVEFPPDGPVG